MVLIGLKGLVDQIILVLNYLVYLLSKYILHRKLYYFFVYIYINKYGAVNNPCVVEEEMSIPLKELIERHCGIGICIGIHERS